MRRILITGSNRGIGFDLVERYLQHDDTLIFATCRNPTDAKALNALAEQYSHRLTVLKLDVTDQTSIDEARRLIGTQVDGLEMQEDGQPALTPQEWQAYRRTIRVETQGQPAEAGHYAADSRKRGKSGD